MLIEEDHFVELGYRMPVEEAIKLFQEVPTGSYLTEGYGELVFSYSREETPEEREERRDLDRSVILGNIKYYERLISDLKEKLNAY